MGAAGIAAIHSIFNIFATLILLPFTKGLEKLAYLTIPAGQEELEASESQEEFSILDVRFLSTPGFAIEQCLSLVRKMAETAGDVMTNAMELFEHYSKEKAELVKQQEELLDRYEDKLGAYLTQLSSQNLTAKEGQSVSALIHSINDFERIGDHALNLMEIAGDMKKKKIEFSKKAKHELEVFGEAVQDILKRSISCDSFHVIMVRR